MILPMCTSGEMRKESAKGRKSPNQNQIPEILDNFSGQYLLVRNWNFFWYILKLVNKNYLTHRRKKTVTFDMMRAKVN